MSRNTTGCDEGGPGLPYLGQLAVNFYRESLRLEVGVQEGLAVVALDPPQNREFAGALVDKF